MLLLALAISYLFALMGGTLLFYPFMVGCFLDVLCNSVLVFLFWVTWPGTNIACQISS